MTEMARLIEFEDLDEWAAIKKIVAEDMLAEGFSLEDIETVSERLRAYREKYLSNIVLDFRIDKEGWAPDIVEKIEQARLRVQREWSQVLNVILAERFSAEVRWLGRDCVAEKSALDCEPIN
jgi:hypothetical protein